MTSKTPLCSVIVPAHGAAHLLGLIVGIPGELVRLAKTVAVADVATHLGAVDDGEHGLRHENVAEPGRNVLGCRTEPRTKLCQPTVPEEVECPQSNIHERGSVPWNVLAPLPGLTVTVDVDSSRANRQ